MLQPELTKVCAELIDNLNGLLGKHVQTIRLTLGPSLTHGSNVVVEVVGTATATKPNTLHVINLDGMSAELAVDYLTCRLHGIVATVLASL